MRTLSFPRAPRCWHPLRSELCAVLAEWFLPHQRQEIKASSCALKQPRGRENVSRQNAVILSDCRWDSDAAHRWRELA